MYDYCLILYHYTINSYFAWYICNAWFLDIRISTCSFCLWDEKSLVTLPQKLCKANQQILSSINMLLMSWKEVFNNLIVTWKWYQHWTKALHTPAVSENTLQGCIITKAEFVKKQVVRWYIDMTYNRLKSVGNKTKTSFL